MKIIHITEARRNPEINVKVGALRALLKYKGQDDIYATFSSLNKLGINPRSDFDTPLGVYTYPISYILKQAEENAGVGGALPYASDREFIHVVRAKGHGQVLQNVPQNIMATTYDRLSRRFGLSKDDVLPALKKAHKDSSELNKRWWFFTHNIAVRFKHLTRSPTPMVAWNRILRELGYDYIVDYGDGIIHPNEPTQAVFLSSAGYTQLETILNTNENPALPVEEYKKNTYVGGKVTERAFEELLEPNFKIFGARIIYSERTGFVIKGGSVTNTNSVVVDIDKGILFSGCKLIDCQMRYTGNNTFPIIKNCSIRGGFYDGFEIILCQSKRATFNDCIITGGIHKILFGENNSINTESRVRAPEIYPAPGQTPIKGR